MSVIVADLGETFDVPDEAAMRALGASLVRRWKAGDVILLEGPLGAGKTTLTRGVLSGLGHPEPVRSPTFNLVQLFTTEPPLMHADLYRVKGWQGIGLEDYLETHLCLIEWADRAAGLVPVGTAWRVAIDFAGEGRRVAVTSPDVR